MSGHDVAVADRRKSTGRKVQRSFEVGEDLKQPVNARPEPDLRGNDGKEPHHHADHRDDTAAAPMHAKPGDKVSHRMRDSDQTKRMDQDRQTYDEGADEQIEDHAHNVLIGAAADIVLDQIWNPSYIVAPLLAHRRLGAWSAKSPIVRLRRNR